MPTTVRGQFRCTAKEDAETPFIALEPMGEELHAARGRVLSIELRAGTTFEEAKALAHQLDQYMVGLAIAY